MRRNALPFALVLLAGCQRACGEPAATTTATSTTASPTANDAAPAIATPTPTPTPTPTQTPAVNANAAPLATLVASGATGCVGWSESERAIACIEGRWGLGVDERSWALVVRSGATRTPFSLAPGPDFPAPGAVTDDPLPAAARARAQARLTSGGFRTITNGRTIEAGATLTLGILRVSYSRAAASAGANNSAPQFNERLEIIPDATGTAIEVFSFNDVATGDTGPVVTLYPVVGGPFVVHRSASTADEGINQIEEQVWVCDLAARRCE